MDKKFLWGILPALFFAGAMTSCSDENDTPSGDSLLAGTFTNKLSAGTAANLKLTYEGDTLIGKEVRLSTENGVSTLRLKGILPGDSCTTVSGVSLVAGDGGYTFSGSGTASNVSTTFKYTGTVTTDGQMTLSLTNVRVPQGSLGQLGTLSLPLFNGQVGEYTTETIDGRTVDVTSFKAPIYYKMVTKHPDETNVVQLAYVMMLGTVLNNVVTSTLDDVTFSPDGNITAMYKSLNDTIGFQQLMNYAGLPHPDRSEFAASPRNLAMYYFSGANTMYVVPNVDQITAQVQADRTRALGNNPTAEKMANIAAVLTKITTTGLRMTVTENPYRTAGLYNGSSDYVRYEGDYVAYADLTDLKSLMEVFDVLRALLPEDVQKEDIFELLEKKGVNLPAEVEEYMPMIKALVPDTTVGGILTLLESNLNDFETLQLGFYLKAGL